MKNTLLLCLLCCVSLSFAQKTPLNLSNVVIAAQLDKAEDRFTMEINLAELLADAGLKTMVSLNTLKQGAAIETLGLDSIQKVLAAKGFDTYVLVSVRGYDNRFKPATTHPDLQTSLGAGHLFPIYREGATSVTLEFLFYRNGEYLGQDLFKIGSIGSRNDVIKKLRKKLPKRIKKRWK